MNLQHIFAVTICIDSEINETFHVHRPDGTPPNESDISDRVLPHIRKRVHLGSTFEIIEVVDVQSSLDMFNNLTS